MAGRGTRGDARQASVEASARGRFAKPHRGRRTFVICAPGRGGETRGRGAYLVRDVVDGQVEVGAQHLEGEALRLASRRVSAFGGARRVSVEGVVARARGGGGGRRARGVKVLANDGSLVARFAFLRVGMAKKGSEGRVRRRARASASSVRARVRSRGRVRDSRSTRTRSARALEPAAFARAASLTLGMFPTRVRLLHRETARRGRFLSSGYPVSRRLGAGVRERCGADSRTDGGAGTTARASRLESSKCGPARVARHSDLRAGFALFSRCQRGGC